MGNKEGFKEIKQHAYFKNIDWGKLELAVTKKLDYESTRQLFSAFDLLKYYADIGKSLSSTIDLIQYRGSRVATTAIERCL